LVPKLSNLKQVKNVIDGAASIFTASNFSVNLFPIHSNSIDQSIRGSAKTYAITLGLVEFTYLSLSTATVAMYGSGIANDVLISISKKYPIDAEGKSLPGATVYPESYVMQVLFLIIIACHIPYLFFSGKEALLIIIDEYMRNSISATLSKKLLDGADMDEVH